MVEPTIVTRILINKRSGADDYHCIRRAIYYQYAIFKIWKKNKDNEIFKKSQIRKVLRDISKLAIIEKQPKKFYEYLKKYFLFFPHIKSQPN